MNREIEELREDWNETKRLVSPQGDSAFRLYRRETTLHRLSSRYLRFAFLSLMCAVVSPYSLYKMSVQTGIEPVWLLPLLFVAVFLLCAAKCFLLFRSVSSIDVERMDVSEVAERVERSRRQHLGFMAIMLPTAIALVAFMAYNVRADEPLMLTVIGGGLVGLLIGGVGLWRYMQNYREMRE